MNRSLLFALVFCLGCGVETDSPVEDSSSRKDPQPDAPAGALPPASPWLTCGDTIVHEVIVSGITYVIEEPVACTEEILPEDPRPASIVQYQPVLSP